MTEAALRGIDHTLVGVHDLEAARERWQSLGFTVTPRGRHIGWGTANYCVMLGEGYIELLGIIDASLFTNDLDRFLATREGLLGIAFASDDPQATKERLVARGLHPDGPKDLKRLLELPEGTVTPEFRLLYLPKEETPDLSAFVCCHLTPELVRRPAWLDHANGAKALAGVTVVTRKPERAAAGYRPYFGGDPTAPSAGVAEIASAAGTLRFATPDAFARLFPKHGLDLKPPMAAAMTLEVASLAKTGAFLAQHGFPTTSTDANTLYLPSEAGNGAVLEFQVSAKAP